MEITQPPRIVRPDPEILAILRLFLEKYEALAEQDRILYRRVLAALTNPPLVAEHACAKKISQEIAKGGAL